MKVSFIGQPYDRLFPPEQNSIGLILYRTAMELGRAVHTAVYGKKYRNEILPPQLAFDFVPVAVPFDEWVQQAIRSHPRLAARFGIEGWTDSHWQYLRRVAVRLEADGTDIIHVMNYWMWCRALKRDSARRIVLDMHCEWLSQRDRDLVARQLEHVSAIVAVSDHVANRFRAAFPHFDAPVVTIGNGVDTERFRPLPHPPPSQGSRRKLLFVGRVSPEKGIHTLIEAFARIAPDFADVDLCIAGPAWVLSADFLTSLSSDPQVTSLLRFYDRWGGANYAQHLGELVRKSGLEARVEFVGNLPHERVADAYRAAYAVVNPSLSESFGMSIVEGMSCGVPVIGTRVGGMCESIVDGQTGLLVQPDSPEALGDAMATLLSDPERAARLGAAGRERVLQHYTWRKRADRLLDVYQRVASAP